MKSRGRKEVLDFLQGMDTSSFEGVISGMADRFPLVQNFRIRDSGRLERRAGFKYVSANQLPAPGTVVASHFHREIGTPIVIKNSIGNIYESDIAGKAAVKIQDYAPADLADSGLTANIIVDDNDRTYVPGNIGHVLDWNTSSLKYEGRRWGIIGPAAAPTVAEGPVGQIPPSSIGWFYYYTYIRKVGTDLIAESTPSPTMAAIFTSAGALKHDLGLVASTDPQVTNIRIYRTEDGGSVANSFFVEDAANATASVLINKKDDEINVNATCNVFGFYPFADSNSPKLAQGNIVIRYKDSILVGGKDDFVYFTAQRSEEKFKYLFSIDPLLLSGTEQVTDLANQSSFSNMHGFVSAMFVHENDIIICTRDTTWRIVDGDWLTGKREAAKGIGVIAQNSIAYDPVLQRTIALTNKGVRSWNGTSWSIDLSYQIRGDIDLAGFGESATPNYKNATAAIANREYHLAFIGADTDPVPARIFVGRLNDDGKVAWEVDKTTTPSLAQGEIFVFEEGLSAGFYPLHYKQQLYAVMRVGATGSQQNRLVQFEGAADYDFGTDRVNCQIQLPRILHNSPMNSVRIKRIRVITTLPVPYSSNSEAYHLLAEAVADSGYTSQKLKLVQDEVSDTQLEYITSGEVTPTNASRMGDEINPLGARGHYTPRIVQGNFNQVFGRGYIDVTLKYDGLAAMQINSATMDYIWRDKEIKSQQLGG